MLVITRFGTPEVKTDAFIGDHNWYLPLSGTSTLQPGNNVIVETRNHSSPMTSKLKYERQAVGA
jgi:hypothetical protein